MPARGTPQTIATPTLAATSAALNFDFMTVAPHRDRGRDEDTPVTAAATQLNL
jgi:hypothetical protein